MAPSVWLLLAALLGIRQEPSVETLRFMSGCWELTTPTGSVEELWTAPRGGTMLGVSRTVRDGSTVAWEALRIEARDGALFYHAAPAGQAPATFRMKTMDGESVTFENPQHDFPQRILYRAAPGDSLHARIEGDMNGQSRGADVHYGRVRCPAD